MIWPMLGYTLALAVMVPVSLAFIVWALFRPRQRDPFKQAIHDAVFKPEQKGPP